MTVFGEQNNNNSNSEYRRFVLFTNAFILHQTYYVFILHVSSVATIFKSNEQKWHLKSMLVAHVYICRHCLQMNAFENLIFAMHFVEGKMPRDLPESQKDQAIDNILNNCSRESEVCLGKKCGKNEEVFHRLRLIQLIRYSDQASLICCQ